MEEILFALFFAIVGTALHYLKKYDAKIHQKQKEDYEQFLKSEKESGKMEYNIRKTNFEMSEAYSKWLPALKWLCWLAAVFILYRGICKIFGITVF